MLTGFQQDSEGDFIYKDPNAKKNYRIDWTDWLNGEDTLDEVVWNVPAGITKESESNSDTMATITLSGGTVNKSYLITCHITTVGGNEDDKSFRVVVVNQ